MIKSSELFVQLKDFSKSKADFLYIQFKLLKFCQAMSKHRIKILIWFLFRPSLYKQFIREIFSFFKRDEHPSLSYSKEAIHWCEENSCDEESALLRVNPSWKYHDFNKEFPLLVKDGFEIIKSFDFNWGGQGNISLNYSLAKNLNARNIIETGVAYGWSSLCLLTYLKECAEGCLVSIDMPFWGTEHEDKIGCVVPQEMRNKWRLIRLPDRDSIPKFVRQNSTFDLCHYDSDKTYSGKMWALPKLWIMIKKGGVLICDDINDNLAFKHFCESELIEPIIVKTFDSQVVKYVGVAVKGSP